MGRKAPLLSRDRYRFPIAHTRHMTDEPAFLISDPDLHAGNLMMVADANSFSPQTVTLVSGGYEHDVIGDSEGELASMIHEGSYG